MSEASGLRRPREVTIVAFLVWAEGIVYVIAGMIIFVNLTNADLVARAGGAQLVRPLAITTFVVALVFLGASGGLLRGSPLSRVVISALMVISIFVAAYIISGGERILGGSLILALAIAALILLWAPRSNGYFESRSTPSKPSGRA